MRARDAINLLSVVAEVK